MTKIKKLLTHYAYYAFITFYYFWALARAQTPSCYRFYPCYHLLFTACKNIHPFKSYAHICEHLPGPYYRDFPVDYHRPIDLPTLIAKVSYLGELRYTKPKEIGLIATTRFEDLDLTCVIG